MFNNQSFTARISDTEQLREQGLSGTSGLSAHEAMIFVFPNDDLIINVFRKFFAYCFYNKIRNPFTRVRINNKKNFTRHIRR
jgi:hypothetical protein